MRSLNRRRCLSTSSRIQVSLTSRQPRSIECRRALSFFPHLVKESIRLIPGHLALSSKVKDGRHFPEDYLSRISLHSQPGALTDVELLTDLQGYGGLPTPRNHNLLSHTKRRAVSY